MSCSQVLQAHGPDRGHDVAFVHSVSVQSASADRAEGFSPANPRGHPSGNGCFRTGRNRTSVALPLQFAHLVRDLGLLSARHVSAYWLAVQGGAHRNDPVPSSGDVLVNGGAAVCCALCHGQVLAPTRVIFCQEIVQGGDRDQPSAAHLDRADTARLQQLIHRAATDAEHQGRFVDRHGLLWQARTSGVPGHLGGKPCGLQLRGPKPLSQSRRTAIGRGVIVCKRTCTDIMRRQPRRSRRKPYRILYLAPRVRLRFNRFALFFQRLRFCHPVQHLVSVVPCGAFIYPGPRWRSRRAPSFTRNLEGHQRRCPQAEHGNGAVSAPERRCRASRVVALLSCVRAPAKIAAQRGQTTT
jgi:hypothetical protein